MPNPWRPLLAAGVTLVVAPGLAALLYLAGRPEPAGLLTGLAAGLLLRDRPARAAVATLCGSATAVVLGLLFVQGHNPDGADFADAMAGWPGWPAGAVLAYVLAARRLPRWGRPATRTLVTAGVLGAVLCCAQLVIAKTAGMTLWEDYHEWDGPGLYRDLTRAAWYPAAAVVVATLTATRVLRERDGRVAAGDLGRSVATGERGGFVAVPLAAWLGCVVAGGPVQYAQALGAGPREALLALLAALAGGAIGAAGATAALGRPGIWLGLSAFVLLFTAEEATGGWMMDLPEFEMGLYGPAALVAAIAAWTAWRERSTGAGVVAGLAGPLLIWSVYLLVGLRHYDHASQSGPYGYALLTALAAMAVAPVAAGLARALRPAPLPGPRGPLGVTSR
ncbi:hypothetical protein HCN51_46320 [Nonomuraea sp. FMUSA5-5]|uniref:Uncharacterized protein n=1 Tax=Nonomuraea composti TaxID=2720023 RepID=A0ABX1BG87_9ACTN|nr:hypothetical protein [Nonomuraea sp. FMUSA5-5]NJP96765.1 hypothetical protein [Nonomuraea sp. FMUSA5-5]